MTGLSVNDLVTAQVLLSPTAVPTQNFGTLLILGSSPVIDVLQRYRNYSTLSSVASDFGTSAPEYLAASLFYGQSPQPTTCQIGRWAQTATSGILHGGSLSATQQAIANFTAISAGGFAVTIDGSLFTATALNFSGQTNLNGVAAIIATALGSHATCVWNANYARFDITSSSSGSSSSMSFGGPPASGVDVSSLLALTAATAASTVAGVSAETFTAATSVLAAATNSWYGLVPAAATMPSDSDLENAAAFVEGLSPRRFMVLTTQETGAYNSSSTTDLAGASFAAAYSHTAVQYSSTSPYAGASLFARQATVNFNANNSTITLMYKQEPLVTAETLSEAQAAALKAKNCNVFVNYSNGIAIVQWGTVASGQFIDTIVGTDWLQNALQTALLNALYTSTTKIPQTDAGVNLLVAAAEVVLSQALANGLIAPGVWYGPNLGKIVTGQTLAKGYYVYAPTVASQTLAQLGARAAPTLQCAIKLGGAIHTASLLIEVSQ